MDMLNVVLFRKDRNLPFQCSHVDIFEDLWKGPRQMSNVQSASVAKKGFGCSTVSDGVDSYLSKVSWELTLL